MAKIKKKGQSGQARNYITRTQAVRKLQISLPDFRRLCIFKGIYPREPRNLKKANKAASHSTTFYYTKDIQYLLHEPLLAKFREQKALYKKIARSLGRNEVHDAVRLEKYGMPKIKLDHIVRERYPTFVDALRDLDDALSLLFLFANLPSTPTVPQKVIGRCQRLCHEFEHYLIVTHSLRKSFLSIKGIYYQATIQGEDVMWLVPYRFVQRVTQEVDYRIMGTFVEFYCTLLGFVNYRLYTSIGLVYPPKFNQASDDKGAELGAFTLEGRNMASSLENGEEPKALTNGETQTINTAKIQKELDKIIQSEDRSDEILESKFSDDEQPEPEGMDKFQVTAPEGDVLEQPQTDSDQAGRLFSGLTFFISREAPRHPVEFLLRAFGCKRVAWDAVLGEGAFTNDESDPRITHQIVDRPAAAVPPQPQPGVDEETNHTAERPHPAYIIPGRIYVQPQWVWDCVNEGKLLRADLYVPGATLPPHLSPWIKPSKGQYDPRATLAEQELEGEADELLSDENARESNETPNIVENEAHSEEESIDEHGMDVEISQEDSDEKESVSSEIEVGESDDAFAEFDDGERYPSADENEQHQAELEAEALGLGYSTGDNTTSTRRGEKAAPKVGRKPKKTPRQLEVEREKEDIERQKMMMSNKKRKLYEKMARSNDRRDEEARKLRAKRRKIERER